MLLKWFLFFFYFFLRSITIKSKIINEEHQCEVSFFNLLFIYLVIFALLHIYNFEVMVFEIEICPTYGLVGFKDTEFIILGPHFKFYF